MGQQCTNLTNCFDKNGQGLPDQRDSIASQSPSGSAQRRRILISKRELSTIQEVSNEDKTQSVLIDSISNRVPSSLNAQMEEPQDQNPRLNASGKDPQNYNYEEPGQQRYHEDYDRGGRGTFGERRDHELQMEFEKRKQLRAEERERELHRSMEDPNYMRKIESIRREHPLELDEIQEHRSQSEIQSQQHNNTNDRSQRSNSGDSRHLKASFAASTASHQPKSSYNNSLNQEGGAHGQKGFNKVQSPAAQASRKRLEEAEEYATYANKQPASTRQNKFKSQKQAAVSPRLKKSFE